MNLGGIHHSCAACVALSRANFIGSQPRTQSAPINSVDSTLISWCLLDVTLPDIARLDVAG